MVMRPILLGLKYQTNFWLVTPWTTTSTFGIWPIFVTSMNMERKNLPNKNKNLFDILLNLLCVFYCLAFDTVGKRKSPILSRYVKVKQWTNHEKALHHTG